MTNSDLRQRAQEIARLHDAAEEAKQILADAYDAAASDGYSKPALRKAIKLHRMDADKRAKHDTEQGDIETYLAELEGRRIEDAKTQTEATLAYFDQKRRIQGDAA